MVYASENLDYPKMSNKKSIIALETTLHQSLSNLKELVSDFEQLQMESNNYKFQVLTQKEKCESKSCASSEALKKVIETKDNIIQSIASALTQLNETRDMNIIHDAFKIICGETASLTPPKEDHDKMKTPKKEPLSETADVDNESISEIEGTPTGRTSPVILSKKYRNASASDFREKKKCPDSWPIPENKTLKLTFPTPGKGKNGGKLKQTRFKFVKQNSFVDLTSSPEFSGGSKGAKDTNCLQLNNVKKESFDDEETIQPSPTSLTSNFTGLYRSKNTPMKIIKNSPHKITKNSPSKFVKKQLQLSKLQIKCEDTAKCNVENVETKLCDPDATKMEESINLLRPVNRFRTPDMKSPLKMLDPEETDCEIDSSMSLLRPVNMLEKKSPEDKKNSQNTQHQKGPLTENINCTNLQTQCDTVSSMSLLNHDPMEGIITKKDLELIESIESNLKENGVKVEAVFKEPTVRKKAEKRALPGWFCDECKNFYAELYKDNPEMLAKKMDECSKHRGKNNPARPKTPPGFWNPRWDVPEDTEEFNRRNNAV